MFTTAVTYGVVHVRNLDIQPGNAFHRTQRTSINLMWNPVPFVDIVVEYLAGTRVNKDGQRASSSQIQSGWTLKFEHVHRHVPPPRGPERAMAYRGSGRSPPRGEAMPCRRGYGRLVLMVNPIERSIGL